MEGVKDIIMTAIAAEVVAQPIFELAQVTSPHECLLRVEVGVLAITVIFLLMEPETEVVAVALLANLSRTGVLPVAARNPEAALDRLTKTAVLERTMVGAEETELLDSEEMLLTALQVVAAAATTAEAPVLGVRVLAGLAMQILRKPFK